MAESNELYGINHLQLIVLFANVLLAKEDKDIGYQDIDTPLKELKHRLETSGSQIRHRELEAALWACVMMAEKEQFWHPEGESFKTFIFKLFNARYVDKHFHEIYCQIKEKPQLGRPRKED